MATPLATTVNHFAFGAIDLVVSVAFIAGRIFSVTNNTRLSILTIDFAFLRQKFRGSKKTLVFMGRTGYR